MSPETTPDNPAHLDEHSTPPAAAADVYGARLDVAREYWRILATDGIDHGLMGPREVPRLWDRHILNCAVIGELMEPSQLVTDVGSGAGLPGLALAIARPDLTLNLVEPLLRRSEFLERAVTALGLGNVTVTRGRAEEKVVRSSIELADVVTSRAVAPLERLAKWSAPLVRDGGRLVAIKGSSAEEEIERDRAVVGRAGITSLSVRTCGEGLLQVPTTVVIGVKASGRKGKKHPSR